ncbi:hypothetical protein B296_00034768, partial [Ensete ventricosum]
KVEFQSVFHTSSQKFKIQANSNVLALRKSYEHGFTKKHDGHKLCTKSRAKSSFDRFFMHRLENLKYYLFIPMLLAHGKSYKHGFKKKCDDHQLCVKSHAKSSFDRFLVHRLGNSKYWPFPMY